MSASPQPTVEGYKQVPRVDLQVACGRVEEDEHGYLSIVVPQVRATQRGPETAKAARLVFTYHGPTKEVVPLASGQVVYQIGLKLRAKNTCNLLYVMWKLDENERVAVSVKRNPGQSTNNECGAGGYLNIRPEFQETVPSAKDGGSHSLEAELSKPNASKYELVVKADGTIVWKGSIEATLLNDIDGPAGFRSDNGLFKFYSKWD